MVQGVSNKKIWTLNLQLDREREDNSNIAIRNVFYIISYQQNAVVKKKHKN